jgi:hypothetical protein
MASVTFDTHRYISRLRQGGILRAQPDALASALADALASATDTLVERNYLDAKLADLRVEMHAMKADIIKWMAVLLILQAGVVAALVKLL